MKRQNPNLKLSEVLYIWLFTVPPCGQVGKNQGEEKNNQPSTENVYSNFLLLYASKIVAGHCQLYGINS